MNTNLVLSTHELYLLCSALGPSVMVGIPNPFWGALADEVRIQTEFALHSLINRGLIHVALEGEIAVDHVLALMIEACMKSDNVIVVTRQTESAAPQYAYIHVTPEFIVEHEEIDKEAHQLRVMVDRTAAIERLGEYFFLKDKNAAKSGKFKLQETTLFQARELVKNGNTEAARYLLLSAQLDLEQTDSLIQGLVNPVSNSVAVALVNRNRPSLQYVKGLGVLDTRDGMWSLHSRPTPDGNIIEFTPSSADEIKARIEDLIPKM